MVKVIVVGIMAYILGNFSTSYILGKILEKKDIRHYGSGNAGATNALRVFGLKIAAATFFMDALKAIIAVLIGGWILEGYGGLIAGVSVVLGHNWPLVLKFKGGKGIASTIGAVLIINPIVALLCVVIGIIIIIITKYVSLGSVTAMTLLPIIGSVIVKPFNISFFIFTLLLSLMALLRHRANIFRLLNGNENRIRQKTE